MPIPYKLGKKPPVDDPRVPRMSVALTNLPAPPPAANWFAAMTGGWPMLGNDKLGDCVEAAVLHCIQQFSTYAGSPLMPTETEAITLYEKAAGYNPADPNSDQGSYVLGQGGVMQYWMTQGATCGGQLIKLDKFMQIKRKNPIEWKQGISLFGGLFVGLALPEAVFNDGYVWNTISGPIAGGHEIWVDGYQTISGMTYYDLISWGQRYRMTEHFLYHCIDECVVVVDDVEMNARGVNGANINMATLVADMAQIR